MDWISVKDRLPEKSVYVLCNCNQYESMFCKDRKFIDYNIPIISWIIGYDNCDILEFSIEKDMYYKVTHWMPLPEPPKE